MEEENKPEPALYIEQEEPEDKPSLRKRLSRFFSSPEREPSPSPEPEPEPYIEHYENQPEPALEFGEPAPRKQPVVEIVSPPPLRDLVSVQPVEATPQPEVKETWENVRDTMPWEDLKQYGHRVEPEGSLTLKTIRAGTPTSNTSRGGSWQEVAIRGEESLSSYGGIPGKTGSWAHPPTGVGGLEVTRGETTLRNPYTFDVTNIHNEGQQVIKLAEKLFGKEEVSKWKRGITGYKAEKSFAKIEKHISDKLKSEGHDAVLFYYDIAGKSYPTNIFQFQQETSQESATVEKLPATPPYSLQIPVISPPPLRDLVSAQPVEATPQPEIIEQPVIEESKPQRKTKIPVALKGLAAEARKSKDFKEFEKNFLLQLKHGTYWHWTDDPNFTIDPTKGPRDMSSMAGGTMDAGKLMITSDIDAWSDYGPQGKGRQYVALVDMSEVTPKDYYQVNRGFGNEFFVSDPLKAKVVKVYTRKQAMAIDRQRRRAVPESEEKLKEFYDTVRAEGYQEPISQPTSPYSLQIPVISQPLPSPQITPEPSKMESLLVQAGTGTYQFKKVVDKSPIFGMTYKDSTGQEWKVVSQNDLNHGYVSKVNHNRVGKKLYNMPEDEAQTLLAKATVIPESQPVPSIPQPVIETTFPETSLLGPAPISQPAEETPQAEPQKPTFESLVKRFEDDSINLDVQTIEGESDENFNNRIHEAAVNKALNDVLEGYSNLNEAKESLESFKDRDIIGYTKEGWEVTPQILSEAIRMRELSQPPTPSYRAGSSLPAYTEPYPIAQETIPSPAPEPATSLPFAMEPTVEKVRRTVKYSNRSGIPGEYEDTVTLVNGKFRIQSNAYGPKNSTDAYARPKIWLVVDDTTLTPKGYNQPIKGGGGFDTKKEAIEFAKTLNASNTEFAPDYAAPPQSQPESSFPESPAIPEAIIPPAAIPPYQPGSSLPAYTGEPLPEIAPLPPSIGESEIPAPVSEAIIPAAPAAEPSPLPVISTTEISTLEAARNEVQQSLEYAQKRQAELRADLKLRTGTRANRAWKNNELARYNYLIVEYQRLLRENNSEELARYAPNNPDRLFTPLPQAEPVAATPELAPIPSSKQPWEMTHEEWSKLPTWKVTGNYSDGTPIESHFYGRNADDVSFQISKQQGENPLNISIQQVDLGTSVPEFDSNSQFVQQALSEGKPVPQEVLADYPELQPKPTGSLSIYPEPIEESHPTPISPPGNRWTGDRGAIPGEPAYFLDGDEETGKAAITELIDDHGGVLFEATDAQGNSIGVFQTIGQAATAAETQFPELTKKIPTMQEMINEYKPIGGGTEVVAEPTSDIGGFEQTLSPASRAKAIVQMNEQHIINSKPQTRKQYIEEAVSQGSVTGEREGQRALIHPNGDYMLQKDITKTALDYADYLKTAKLATPASLPTEAQATPAEGSTIVTRRKINDDISNIVGSWAKGFSVYGTRAGDNSGYQYPLTEIRKIARPGETYYLNRFAINQSYSNDMMDLIIPATQIQQTIDIPTTTPITPPPAPPASQPADLILPIAQIEPIAIQESPAIEAKNPLLDTYFNLVRKKGQYETSEKHRRMGVIGSSASKPTPAELFFIDTVEDNIYKGNTTFERLSKQFNMTIGRGKRAKQVETGDEFRAANPQYKDATDEQIQKLFKPYFAETTQIFDRLWANPPQAVVQSYTQLSNPVPAPQQFEVIGGMATPVEQTQEEQPAPIPSNKYYVGVLSNTGGTTFVEAPKAEPVDIDPAIEAFVYKEMAHSKQTQWVVSEAKTGSGIAEGATRSEAISNAIDRCTKARRAGNDLAKTVNELISQGRVSPRIGNTQVTTTVPETENKTVEVLGKEPWQMTRKEYVEANLFGLGAQRRGNVILLKAQHTDAVTKALAAGKTVPASVLADYPENEWPTVYGGYSWRDRKMTCQMCGKEVATSHPMQTLEAQMSYHLRKEHGMTKEAARMGYRNFAKDQSLISATPTQLHGTLAPSAQIEPADSQIVQIPYGGKAYQELLRDEITVGELKSRIEWQEKQWQSWANKAQANRTDEVAIQQARLYRQTIDEEKVLLSFPKALPGPTEAQAALSIGNNPISDITDRKKFEELVEKKYNSKIIDSYTDTTGYGYLVLDNGYEVKVDNQMARVGKMMHGGFLSPTTIGKDKYSEMAIRKVQPLPPITFPYISAGTQTEFQTIGRMSSGEANLLQTPNGEIIERIAMGDQKGWWKVIVGTTEYVAKTPERAIEIAHERGAIIPTSRAIASEEGQPPVRYVRTRTTKRKPRNQLPPSSSSW